MVYVIKEIFAESKMNVQRLSCMCPKVKKAGNKFYDAEAVQKRLIEAEKVKKQLEAEQIARDEGIRKSAEALKAMYLKP